MDIMESRRKLLDQSTKTIGGLPVLYDNAKYPTSNGRISDIISDNNFFIAGPFDTGSAANKTYTFTQTKTAETNAWVGMRLFNDLDSTSVDYWSCSCNPSVYPASRTITTAGRHIAFTVNKTTASDMSFYDDTNGRYIFKGKNVT